MARRFVDARGTEWEVWEVGVRRTPADVLRPTRPRVRPRAGEKAEPPGLCFESATQRRRLSRYPERWHAMSPAELAALCAEARPEPPTLRSAPLPRGPTPPTAWG